MAAIIRKIDRLGRVIIPKSLRMKHEIVEGDSLEFLSDGEDIVLRRHKPRCVFCSGGSALVKYRDKYVCKACIELLKS